MGRQFGKHAAKSGDDARCQLAEKSTRTETEITAKHYSPAQNSPNHVVAIAITWSDPVSDGEAEGTDVIRYDAQSDVDFLLLRKAGMRRLQCPSVAFAAQLRKLFKDWLEHATVLVGNWFTAIFEAFGAVDYAGYAFKTHAGIDMTSRQKRKGTVRIRIELNENQIPDLNAKRVSLVDQFSAAIPFQCQIDVNF